MTFDEFFAKATGDKTPYDYQKQLAGDLWAEKSAQPSSLAINVPTGAGKTAAVVLAWLWNLCATWHKADHAACWPRRLVYCLPLRTLVEQTKREISSWLANLKLHGLLVPEVKVFTLMGGTFEESGSATLSSQRSLSGRKTCCSAER
jgi:CRISPR-associated endonuclease/helicase Cas3